MSTTNLLAGEVMDRVAILLNDPAKTDYTYPVMLPYLNMALDELIENLEESNVPQSNKASAVIQVTVGQIFITSPENSIPPHYPGDMVEIQEVGERDMGTDEPFITMGKRELIKAFPASRSLLYWSWEDNIIKFNPNGATSNRDVELRYIHHAVRLAVSELTIIPIINARSYLSFKTAALCAMFIGENETRAGILQSQAGQALERMEGILNKGKQQIVTRHRPFRAAYKARGGF